LLPAGILAALGTTEIETTLGAPTVSVAAVANEPDAAVMFAVPRPTPVAKPLLMIDAVVKGTEDQVTELVRFWVLPSV
jgi:hypothetical protein